MEFRTGDDVVHPNYGVGNIVRLEERELATSGHALVLRPRDRHGDRLDADAGRRVNDLAGGYPQTGS